MSNESMLKLMEGMLKLDQKNQSFMLGYAMGVAATREDKEAEKNAQAEDDSRAEKAG